MNLKEHYPNCWPFMGLDKNERAVQVQSAIDCSIPRPLCTAQQCVIGDFTRQNIFAALFADGRFHNITPNSWIPMPSRNNSAPKDVFH